MTHILNGDATAYVFRQSGIPGQPIIWREALAAGPVSGLTQGTQTDFRSRREWVIQNWGATAEGYISKVVLEFQRILRLDPEEEITLWFETDLFCQMNLMFLLNRIYHCRPSHDNIFLICPVTVPGRPDFKGFGELSPEELSHLWNTQRRHLSADIIQQYATAWDVYQAPDPAPFISSMKDEDTFTDLILRTAFQAHIARFPDPDSGLNSTEVFLLSLLAQGYSPEEAMQRFLAQDRIYGWGDVQVMDMLRPLEAIIKAGTADIVLRSERSKYDYWSGTEWLGGVRLEEGIVVSG